MFDRLRILRAPEIASPKVSRAQTARLSGRVRRLPGSALAEPVDRDPCVFYHVVVDAPAHGRLYENYNGVPFSLETEAGPVQVDWVPSAAVWLKRSTRAVSPSAVSQLVGGRQIDGDLYLSRAVLKEGDAVWIYGTIKPETSARGESDYRSSPVQLRVVPDPHGLLAIADRPLRRGSLGEERVPTAPASSGSQRRSFWGVRGLLLLAALGVLNELAWRALAGDLLVLYGGVRWFALPVAALVHATGSFVRAARHPLRGARIALVVSGALSQALALLYLFYPPGW